jgi:hypothetical protein
MLYCVTQKNSEPTQHRKPEKQNTARHDTSAPHLHLPSTNIKHSNDGSWATSVLSYTSLAHAIHVLGEAMAMANGNDHVPYTLFV